MMASPMRDYAGAAQAAFGFRGVILRPHAVAEVLHLFGVAAADLVRDGEPLRTSGAGGLVGVEHRAVAVLLVDNPQPLIRAAASASRAGFLVQQRFVLRLHDHRAAAAEHGFAVGSQRFVLIDEYVTMHVSCGFFSRS